MSVFCCSNVYSSNGDRLRQRANSVHNPDLRLSALMDDAPMMGCGLVSMKFQPSHASTADLPGPVQAFMHMRREVGKRSKASSCHASGSILNNSRTIWAGCWRQRAMASAAGG